MTIKELFSLAVDKKITYSEVVEKLKELKLSYEEQESYEQIFYKMLGNPDKLDHSPKYFFSQILNHQYFPILAETIKMVRSGAFSPEICQYLYDSYGLSSPLINYFVNEAISIVRMNTLSKEEIANIGMAYHRMASLIEERNKNKPQDEQEDENVEIQNEQINALPVDEVTIFDEE